MAETYKVTERVLADHPDGYQVLAAVPGDEIPVERAIELGLVTRSKKTHKDDGGDDETGDAEKSDGSGAVVTAETRRSRSRQPRN